MAEDITIRPDAVSPTEGPVRYKDLTNYNLPPEQSASQQFVQQNQGVACPSCGTVNDPEAMFCATCGKPLKAMACPNCGSEVDADADFCEVCHHYIRTGICSFCGTEMAPGEIYCHECGNPRGGIVCPVCNTLNDFSFCKQCGTPLTDEAHELIMAMKKQPDYQILLEEVRTLEDLNAQIPYSSERDVVRDQKNEDLRLRVLMLLANDKGISDPMVTRNEVKRCSKEELQAKKEEKMKIISDILDRMALPAMPSPIKARNYAMAQKPAGVRLAWVCNWKHAMHSSPCGCAKPHMGGKWVILGRTSSGEIKDDK